jgi:hypothetical protein
LASTCLRACSYHRHDYFPKIHTWFNVASYLLWSHAWIHPAHPIEIQTPGDIECYCKHRATHRGRAHASSSWSSSSATSPGSPPRFRRLRCALGTWRLTLIPRAMAVYASDFIAHRASLHAEPP